MSDFDSKGLNFFNWPSLTLFVLLSWGILLVPPSMRSLRPSGGGGQPIDMLNQIYEARLWQDPFDILPQAKANRGSMISLQALLDETNPNERRLVFAVFLAGANYPEDLETRLRTRYAVVSALAVSGYFPEDSGNLRCATSPWPMRKAKASDRDPIFPYENYRRSQPKAEASGDAPSIEDDLTLFTHVAYRPKAPQTVTVIWIDEQLFDAGRFKAKPVDMLLDFANACSPDTDLAIIGPQFSSTLQQFLEAGAPNPRPSIPRLAEIAPALAATAWFSPVVFTELGVAPPKRPVTRQPRIYSYSSTVDSLRPAPGDPPCNSPFEVVRTIGTDRDLAKVLRHELALRGVDFTQGTGAIAIVGEWDTLYSRSAFQAFHKEFDQPNVDIREPQSHLRFFTYQQGLDGRLPSEQSSDSKPNEKQPSKLLSNSGSNAKDPTELSYSKSQIDYLKRLVGQMKQLEPGNWVAIGLIGSDFYDKMMILETLKHEFPDAIFFTTDMDQRYLDPPVRQTTRNLLIASHYGLALNECLQRGIPPFRLSYQSALFLGCLRALADHDVPPPTCSFAIGSPEQDSHHEVVSVLSANDQFVNPLIFEIGQNQVTPFLNPDFAAEHPEKVHPGSYERSEYLGVWPLTLTLILLAFCIAWLYFLWPTLGQRLRSQWRGVLALFAVFAAVVAIAMIDHTRPNGEPLSFLDGISTWPTVFVRFAVAIFCIGALVFSQSTDEENLDELTWKYGLFGGHPRRPGLGGKFIHSSGKGRRTMGACLRRFHRIRSARLMLGPRPASHHSQYSLMTIDPRRYWLPYCWLSSSRIRAWRVLAQVLIYSFCALLLTQILDHPRDPHRGALNLWTAWSLLYFLVAPAMLALFWFVIDAHRVCIRLIDLLDGPEPVIWSSTAQHRAAAVSGFDFYQSSSGKRMDLQDPSYQCLLNPLTSLTILAKRTAVIGPMMYLPVLAYLLLFLARSPFFDQFVMSWFLIVVFSGGIFALICCGAWLRLLCQRARQRALVIARREIQAQRLIMLDNPNAGTPQVKQDSEKLEILKKISRAISKVQDGAFSSLGNDPVLRTLLVILGGVGALLSMEPIRQFLQ